MCSENERKNYERVYKKPQKKYGNLKKNKTEVLKIKKYKN